MNNLRKLLRINPLKRFGSISSQFSLLWIILNLRSVLNFKQKIKMRVPMKVIISIILVNIRKYCLALQTCSTIIKHVNIMKRSLLELLNWIILLVHNSNLQRLLYMLPVMIGSLEKMTLWRKRIIRISENLKILIMKSSKLPPKKMKNF